MPHVGRTPLCLLRLSGGPVDLLFCVYPYDISTVATPYCNALPLFVRALPLSITTCYRDLVSRWPWLCHRSSVVSPFRHVVINVPSRRVNSRFIATLTDSPPQRFLSTTRAYRPRCPGDCQRLPAAGDAITVQTILTFWIWFFTFSTYATTVTKPSVVV